MTTSTLPTGEARVSYEAALVQHYANVKQRLGLGQGVVRVSRAAIPVVIVRPALPSPRRRKPRKPKAELCEPVPITASRSRLPWRPLIYAILAEHGTNMPEVQSDCRVRKVVGVRRLIAQLLRERGWSTPQIGALICKDHATILNLLHPERRRSSKALRHELAEAQHG